MEYNTGKKLVSGAGLAALLLGGGAAAEGSTGNRLEKITSPALKQQMVEVQYQQQAKSDQYLASDCCINGCECCVCGEFPE